VEGYCRVGCQQSSDDFGIFDDPVVPPIVWGRVVQADKVVAEAACHHVEVNAAMIEKPERGNHLRHGIWMHVDRLNGNQRTELTCMLEDALRYQPGINDPVVRVNQDSFATICFTPVGNVDHALEVLRRGMVAGLRAGRKDSDFRLQAHLTLPIWSNLKSKM